MVWDEEDEVVGMDRWENAMEGKKQCWRNKQETKHMGTDVAGCRRACHGKNRKR